MLMVPSSGQPGWPIWFRDMLWRVLPEPHWFRTHQDDSTADRGDWPCVYRGCGRPGREHWRWCGEWMLTRRERWTYSLRRLRSVLKKP